MEKIIHKNNQKQNDISNPEILKIEEKDNDNKYIYKTKIGKWHYNFILFNYKAGNFFEFITEEGGFNVIKLTEKEKKDLWLKIESFFETLFQEKKIRKIYLFSSSNSIKQNKIEECINKILEKNDKYYDKNYFSQDLKFKNKEIENIYEKLYNEKFVLIDKNISQIRDRYFLQNFKNFKNWDVFIFPKEVNLIELKRKKI